MGGRMLFVTHACMPSFLHAYGCSSKHYYLCLPYTLPAPLSLPAAHTRIHTPALSFITYLHLSYILSLCLAVCVLGSSSMLFCYLVTMPCVASCAFLPSLPASSFPKRKEKEDRDMLLLY